MGGRSTGEAPEIYPVRGWFSEQILQFLWVVPGNEGGKAGIPEASLLSLLRH